MSMYLSVSPGIERAAAENTSAFPAAPQVAEAVRSPRLRVATAALLRRVAHAQFAAAARLERPVHHSLAA